MNEKEIAEGRLAFKLFHKKSATGEERGQAFKWMENADVDKLDIYGKFVWAEIAYQNVFASKKDRIKAFEIFLKISQSKKTPLKLLLCAHYFVARAYEHGNGVERNRFQALKHYVEANKINNKYCKEDIDRMNASVNPPRPPRATDTPYEYQYRFSVKEADDDAVDEHLEAVYDYRNEMAEEHLRRMKTLKKTGFYYDDEPELINLADLDMYCVDGVTKDDLIRPKEKPMRLDEYDEYGYGDDYFDENPPDSLFIRLLDEENLDFETMFDGVYDDDDDDE